MDNRLFWIDLEMTGLDPERHIIIEIASIITDAHLDIVAIGPDIVIHYPESDYSSMEEWSQEHHQASGLLDRSRISSYNCRQAEQATVNFISRYCPDEKPPLCGNSIWQDRRFIIQHMPRLDAQLNYRNVDVSSIKELVRRWYPTLPPFKKEKLHLAMDDIKESIMELKYYRKNVFLESQV